MYGLPIDCRHGSKNILICLGQCLDIGMELRSACHYDSAKSESALYLKAHQLLVEGVVLCV
jgi:hypothetical protein